MTQNSLEGKQLYNSKVEANRQITNILPKWKHNGEVQNPGYKKINIGHRHDRTGITKGLVNVAPLYQLDCSGQHGCQLARVKQGVCDKKRPSNLKSHVMHKQMINLSGVLFNIDKQ